MVLRELHKFKQSIIWMLQRDLCLHKHSHTTGLCQMSQVMPSPWKCRTGAAGDLDSLDIFTETLPENSCYFFFKNVKDQTNSILKILRK